MRGLTSVLKATGLTHITETDVGRLLDRMGIFRSSDRTMSRSTTELLEKLPAWVEAAGEREKERDIFSPQAAPHHYPIR